MESVKTALRVLEAVVESQLIGVSELARKLQEPKTTIQRCLTTLHDAGYVRPVDGTRRRWAVTNRLLLLSKSADPEPRLREIALPVMRWLRDETRETIHLMVPEGGEVVLIDRLDSPQPVRTVRQLGAHAPLHVASNGKAALAAMNEAEREAYIRNPLVSWTKRTITDADRLRQEIAKVRELGYAVSFGELDPEVHAVAAAILNSEGKPIATMSVSCPASRLPIELIPKYGVMVAKAAAEISRNLKSANAEVSQAAA
ncbi:IclR family transcriptional regulator [Ferrovibrio xuzhouensis]|uniref:IclR family transcriptional regulator n=1 Tax=Ferrovibrio xuzhouensis TaxID=1576914 RepID=UPI0036D428B6